MNIKILIILIFFCATQLIHSQEDGVVSLAIPVRNSLRFNRHLINPAFSFVREQHRYISFTNKREWVQFENAPLTYVAGYSGRFRENIGAGISLFQQDYGVLTTFGGLLNFAYNVRLDRESNLTFGLNLGAYSSGLNEGKVIANMPDPSLDNIPSNFLLSISPGINYGTTFLDFGVSVNNAVQYNFNNSNLIEDDPQRSIQVHAMYTGYLDTRGFFDRSKFSSLLRSEFKKDETIISGIAMLTVPKGIWGQVGYNTVYGFSGGFGLNITKQIAIEYNYEKAIGDMALFGSSHEITLAYKFKNNDRYVYSGDDDESAIILLDKKRKPKKGTSTMTAEQRAQRKDEVAAAKAKARSEREVKLASTAATNAQADEDARLTAAIAAAKAKSDEEARLAAEAAAAKAKSDEEARLAAEAEAAKAKSDEEARVAAAAVAAKAKADEEARLAADKVAKEKADAAEKLAQENAEKAKLAEEARLAKEAEANRLAAEEAAKAKAEADAQKAQEALAKEKAEETARLAAEEAAKQRAEELALEAAAVAAAVKAKEDAEAEEARIAEEELNEIEINAKAEQERLEAEKAVLLEITHKDDLAKAMFEMTELAKASKAKQENLLSRLNDAIESKNNDLKDLKEENDLSEQGIVQAPKPFKSVTAENKALEALLSDVDRAIDERDTNITSLEKEYSERLKSVPNRNDKTNQYYSNILAQLKEEQRVSVQSKKDLVARLERIKVDLEFERKRRIKRAVYDNEDDRYQKDRAALKQLKESTTASNVELTASDFDFGEARSLDNIQIVKGVANVNEGYYVVLAVHNDVSKRDEFLKKTIASGQTDVEFFYDVNSSKYFIYYETFGSIAAAKRALESGNNKPYRNKMSIVKIEK